MMFHCSTLCFGLLVYPLTVAGRWIGQNHWPEISTGPGIKGCYGRTIVCFEICWHFCSLETRLDSSQWLHTRCLFSGSQTRGTYLKGESTWSTWSNLVSICEGLQRWAALHPDSAGGRPVWKPKRLGDPSASRRRRITIHTRFWSIWLFAWFHAFQDLVFCWKLKPIWKMPCKCLGSFANFLFWI